MAGAEAWSVMTAPSKPHSSRSTLVIRPLWAPDQVAPSRFMEAMAALVLPWVTVYSKPFRNTSRMACSLANTATP